MRPHLKKSRAVIILTLSALTSTILLFCENVSAQIAVTFNYPDTLSLRFEIQGDGVSNTFAVDSLFVLIDSVLTVNDNIKDKSEAFTFIPDSSKIKLTNIPSAGSTIIAFGKRSPLNLRNIYFNRKVEIYNIDPAASGINREFPVRTVEQKSIDEPSLFQQGSLTRAFSFGTNRGLEMQSGLQMQVKGTISENFELQAVLTDRNIPLQPEGNTRTLSEIDKVYINLAGPGFSSRLGDINVSFGGTTFGKLDRKLKGVSALGQKGLHKFSMTVASSEGQYHSAQIPAIEGNQGPYLLTGKNGERNIIVLAGTEKVYIDGELMVRGDDNDYIIEYSSAQIKFTRNRLITEYSRIVVDFEYNDGNYGRNLRGFSLNRNQLGNGFNYSASYVKESDNKNNPQDISFTEPDLRQISSAGDRAELAYKSGVEYVGTGNGNYIKIDTGTKQYYEYNDSGDYRVVFADVGEGNGDYNFVRLSVYEYAGKNNGRYLPVILLPLPRSHSISDFTLGYNSKSLNFSSEIAYSNIDNNMLSDLDDGDNGGNAYNMNFSVRPSKLKLSDLNFGTLSVSAKMRKTDNEFKPIDRTTEIEYDRKWNLDSYQVTGEENFELETIYKPKDFISIQPSLGYLKLGSGFKSLRQSAKLLIDGNRNYNLNYKIENIKSTKSNLDDNWFRQKGTLSYGFKGFTPTLLYESEYKESVEQNPEGFKFDDAGFKLEYRYKTFFSTYGMYSRRNDEEYIEGILQPLSKAENTIFNVDLRHGSRIYSRIHVVHRDRNYYSTNRNVVTDLADIKLQSAELRGGLRTKIDYQLSSEKIPGTEKVWFRVEEGKGYYTLDSLTGEYYQDPNGDYDLRTFITDQLQGVTRNKFGLTFDLAPERFLRSKKGTFYNLKNLRLQTIFRYDNSAGSEDNLTKNSSTLLKRVTLLNDIFILERNNRFNLRFRQQHNFSENNRFVSRKEERTSDEYSVRLRSSIKRKLFTELLLAYDIRKKDILTSSLLSQNIKTLKNDANLSFRHGREWEFLLKIRAAGQEDNSGGKPLKVSYYSLKPGFRRAFLRTGRLSGDFQLFKVKTESETLLPYDFAEGKQPGNSYNWSFSFDYRTTKNLTVQIKYTGDNNTRYVKTLHNLRAELQVLF